MNCLVRTTPIHFINCRFEKLLQCKDPVINPEHTGFTRLVFGRCWSIHFSSRIRGSRADGAPNHGTSVGPSVGFVVCAVFEASQTGFARPSLWRWAYQKNFG